MNLRALYFLSAALFLIFNNASVVLGYTYQYYINEKAVSINILSIDPKEHMITVVKATGEESSREPVAALVAKFGAAAGVNGGFWKNNGDPSGILKIMDKWYGTPEKPRGAIGWSFNGQTTLIDRILTNVTLKEYLLGAEIEIVPASNPPKTTSEQWKNVDFIVGGTPVLINGGQRVVDFSPELTQKTFLTDRHPRTAVGIKASGEWVFVVVDGHETGDYGGMTMDELADLMLELGCVDALNLCGGCSSTMVVEDVIVNLPCGWHGGEKLVNEVSDAILIY